MTIAKKFLLLPAVILVLIFAGACSDKSDSFNLDGKWTIDLDAIADSEISPQEKMLLQGLLGEMQLCVTFDTKAGTVTTSLGEEVDESQKMVFISSSGDTFKYSIDGEEAEFKFTDKDNVTMSGNGEETIPLKRVK